ncbi:MAG: ribosome maturation factor RimP [Acidobacteria bacterium]|nr:ribosome maturation factor RimP [Acidobacteriota bacterium]
MASKELDPSLLAELGAIAEGEGCELVHAEFLGGTLRLVLDRPEGVTLQHCERVSKQASALLDVLDFGPKKYVLEVGSPGLDRPIYRPEDYRRFTGRLARITVRHLEDGSRSTLVGRLQGFDGEQVVLQEEKVTKRGRVAGETFSIRLADIEKARLEIEL